MKWSPSDANAPPCRSAADPRMPALRAWSIACCRASCGSSTPFFILYWPSARSESFFPIFPSSITIAVPQRLFGLALVALPTRDRPHDQTHPDPSHARMLLDHDVVDRQHALARRIAVADPAGVGVLAAPAPDPDADLALRVDRVHAVVAAAHPVEVIDDLHERHLVLARRTDGLPALHVAHALERDLLEHVLVLLADHRQDRERI